MKVKAVIIDMDGTITRFNLDYMGARRKALEELEKFRLRTPEMTEQLSLYLLLKQLKSNLDAETFAMIRKTFYGLLEGMEIKAAQDVVLYPGAVDTLRKLRERGFKIGIVTNNGRAGTELTLKRYGLSGFFQAIVTRDDCEEMKPDGGPVLKILAEMQVHSREAFLVGDGVIDIMAARAAGVLAVAVPTGPFTSERLLQAQPDYLLGSVNDIPSLIDALEASNDN